MKATSLFIGLLLMLVQTTIAQNAEVLTNKTVTDLFKAGLDDAIIIAKIETSACKFDLSTTGLLALKKDNVPAGIIKEMMDKADGKATAPVVTPPPVRSSKKQMPDIEMMNIPYFNDSKENAVIALDKTTGDIKGKITAGNVITGYYFF